MHTYYKQYQELNPFKIGQLLMKHTEHVQIPERTLECPMLLLSLLLLLLLLILTDKHIYIYIHVDISMYDITSCNHAHLSN